MRDFSEKEKKTAFKSFQSWTKQPIILLFLTPPWKEKF